MEKKKSKKKFSFNDRSNYHSKKSSDFIDRFKTKDGSSFDYDRLAKEKKKNANFAYSYGYSRGAHGVLRGFYEKDFDGNHPAYKKGVLKAQRDFEKSLNRKF
ncbi:MAG: hypothetical protein ACI4SH_01430 [Candidatus Scatosoma sp.]